MSTPSLRWRHVIISTHSSWLHGDPRGFRTRDHRIHSSGDYKHRPPPGEHAGLHEYHEVRSGAEVHLPRDLRSTVGRAILDHLIEEKLRTVAIAVAKIHAHFIVELPDIMPQVKSIVGHAKRKSSRAIKSRLPGTVWSAGGTYKPVDNRQHFEKAHDYVIYDQGPQAWTWSYRDESKEGVFGRVRPEE